MKKNENINEKPLKPYADTRFSGKWPKGVYAYLRDEHTGTCYMLPYGEWIIGRKDEDAEVDIPVTTTAEFNKRLSYMSRRHATLTLKRNLIGETSLFIRDFKETTNHTYVDEAPLDEKYNYQLFDEDIIRMGALFFTVHLRL